MTETRVGAGSCLCGAISFTAKKMTTNVAACHCNSCRKWGGSAFMEVNCGPEVEFNDVDKLSVFDSSEWAERGFCSACGSHLFYRLKETQEHMMPVGLFDDDSGLVFRRQVFIDERPHYYQYSNKTEDLTGEELFAQFAPAED
ncbi:MAG: aldehyde-activating protein [SAR86 cluster bacterium]|uniref:Aldehyde-activating protein n=1 Tax=SAR86 cluster bacterium TaxID=2030880 RepID=A0A2A4X2D3_9GAMM|nr:MAG: aldehyde-activating protein [SAR86 cluster bacterium]